MHARLVRFGLAPGSRPRFEALVAELRPLIEARPGCRGATFFGDDAAGEWGVFVLWATSEDAAGAAAVMRPRLDAHLSGHLAAPPVTGLFGVVEVSSA